MPDLIVGPKPALGADQTATYREYKRSLWIANYIRVEFPGKPASGPAIFPAGWGDSRRERAIPR